MWTRAAHGVNPKRAPGSPGVGTRYTLITGYRNPMCREVSKWITPARPLNITHFTVIRGD